MKINRLIILSLIAIFYSSISYAQIKIREINQTKEKIYKNPMVQLDSTKNITIYTDIQRSSQYIGSKIVYCPLSENSSTYGMCDDLYHYSGTNIEFTLDYNNRVARYQINGVILSIDSLLLYKKKQYYILSDVKKNRYLWDISSLKIGTRDAILIPHLNYISQKYVGTKYTPNKTLKNTNSYYIYDLVNIDTGEEEDILKSGKIFTCTGIEFMKADYSTPLLNPFLILKSDSITIRVSFMNKLIGCVFESNDISFRPNIQKDFISVKNFNLSKAQQDKRAAYLKNRYGETIYNSIVNKKVTIGMTKEACIESWGKPTHINSTINPQGSYEQWGYSTGNYLYFNNGVLESIQISH